MPKLSAWSNSTMPSAVAGSEVSVNQLRFFIHHDPDALRIELAGSLSGRAVRNVLRAWQKEISNDAHRPRVADISYVADTDKLGRELLVMWHRSGTRIVARSAQSWALAKPIVSELIDAVAPKRDWFRRLIGFLEGGRPDPVRIPVPVGSMGAEVRCRGSIADWPEASHHEPVPRPSCG